MLAWLRMVVLLRKLYEFEFKPAIYINATEMIKIQEQLPISDKEQLSLYILQTYNLANIKWGKIDIPVVAFITLPSAQQKRIFKYIALDILLHQPSTIIDGSVVKSLFSLFEVSYEQFPSYLQTRISHSTVNNPLNSNLFFTTITTEQVHQLILFLKDQYITSLSTEIQQRLLLSEATKAAPLNIINCDLSEATLAVTFYLQHLWPNRLSLLRKLRL